MLISRASPWHEQRRGISVIELLLMIAITLVLFAMSFAGYAGFVKLRARIELAHWKDSRRLGETAPRRLAPMRVLFIGNSMTYFNRMPEMIQALAGYAGDSAGLEFDSQFVGGATLERHWNEGIALQKIEQGGWDFVVIQEQGLREVRIESQGLVRYGKQFSDAIHRVEAFPVQFLPWAPPDEPQTLAKAIEIHLTVAKSNRAEIAPVGLAVSKAWQAKPSLALIEDDGHPTAVGSYLAACVFYAAFFDKSPVGLPARIVVNGETLVDVPEADAQIIQAAAWDAILEIRKKTPIGGGLFR